MADWIHWIPEVEEAVEATEEDDLTLANLTDKVFMARREELYGERVERIERRVGVDS